MKKVLVLISATFISILFLQAQETHFGIKAGLNMAGLDIKNDQDYDSKAGLYAGGLAHIHISKHFALQPELVFSMQGGEDQVGRLRLNYLNVPILAQFMFNQGFRLQTGPQAGFLISSQKKVGGVEVDYDNRYSSFDFSWTFGAGYLFPQGIGIDARYNLGINDMDETTVEARNRVFQVGLFYQFMHNNTKKK